MISVSLDYENCDYFVMDNRQPFNIGINFEYKLNQHKYAIALAISSDRKHKFLFRDRKYFLESVYPLCLSGKVQSGIFL